MQFVRPVTRRFPLVGSPFSRPRLAPRPLVVRQRDTPDVIQPRILRPGRRFPPLPNRIIYARRDPLPSHLLGHAILIRLPSFLAEYPEPVAGSPNFYAALRTFLLADPGLAPLADWYLRKAPPNFTPPFGIITPINEIPKINNSADYWSDWQIQFAVVSTDDVVAETLGRVAYNALMPKRKNSDGTFVIRPRLSANDSYEIGSYPGRSFILEYPSRWQNRNLWAFIFQYRFMVGRAMGW